MRYIVSISDGASGGGFKREIADRSEAIGLCRTEVAQRYRNETTGRVVDTAITDADEQIASYRNVNGEAIEVTD